LLVRDFMRSTPKILQGDSKLKDVVQVFFRYKESAIAVVDDGDMLCGIITRMDLLEAMAGQVPMTAAVEHIMTKSVVFVHPDNTLEEAWMIPVRHLPVVDHNKHVLGMIHHEEFAELFYHLYHQTLSCLEQVMKLSYSGIIAINENGIITAVNDTASRLIGKKPEEIIGRMNHEITRDTRLMEVVQTGNAIRDDVFEFDGKQVPINRAPIFDGYKVIGAVSVARDMMLNDLSESSNGKDYVKLKEAYDIMEAVFNTMKHGIIFVDTKNIIRLVNNAYEEMLGIPGKELVEQSAEEKVPNSRMHIVLKTGVAELGDFQSVDAAGRQIVANRVPIFKDGKIIGAIGEAVFKDIQEVKKLLKRGEIAAMSDSLRKSSITGKVSGCVGFEQIIGHDAKMVHVKNLAAKVAAMDTTVLESGTGKDLFAQAIHNTSSRKEKKFVAINCAAIPGDLLEAELFGYDEGAFTGAKRGGKKGKLELAEGGTLFLDEIGDMPLAMQAKLLRVMQNKTLEHVGGLTVKTCDVRVLAATNQNLTQLIEQGKFREDLYYRLNVICIEIPPLRKRKEDIRELIDLLMPQLCNKVGESVKSFSSEALQLLCQYDWPGNVRELINILEQTAATVDSMLVQPKHLPELILQQNRLRKLPINEEKNIDIELDETLTIKKALHDSKGNKVLAAKILGIHRSTLYEKLRKYHLR